MKFSLAEIEAVSKKAARGTGYSWGLSEEAGKACRYLVAANLPGPAILSDHLQRLDQKNLQTGIPDPGVFPWVSAHGYLCPLATGALISDLMFRLHQGESFELGPTAAPLLMAAVATGTGMAGDSAILVQWDGVMVTCHKRGVSVSGNQLSLNNTTTEQVNVSSVPWSEEYDTSIAERSDVDPAAWSTLDELAFRTYVPSSEASRAGAGSKLSDND